MKSAAQIRRQMKRAEARGEKYTPPISSSVSTNDIIHSKVDTGHVPTSAVFKAKEKPVRIKKMKTSTLDETEKQKSVVIKDASIIKLQAYEKMIQSLNETSNDTTLDARSRRSAKRKAEAIAAQESGCISATELIEWYEGYKANEQPVSTKASSDSASKKNPCILFIGQLSFHTTSDGIFHHIQKAIGEKKITSSTLKIRLLTQDGKSKGNAFAEFEDPEDMYEALKLHHTQLDGRRINVERSVGGRKNSETRKEKLKQRRKEQEDYVMNTVNKILEEYRERGQLEEDELDDGVKALCYRRSPAIVEAALQEYVEARGSSLDNPSAYLSRIICRITDEGIDGGDSSKNNKLSHKDKPSSLKRKRNVNSLQDN
jgi:RNA recognition motif-containing protein